MTTDTYRNGLNIQNAFAGLFQQVMSRESNLRTEMASSSANMSASDLLKLQKSMQDWSISTQVASTVVKEIAEAAKSVIQKSA